MLEGLGATLRKARNRRGEPLADVEAAIKIRVRHLRAIEEEDWEALPAGSYARSFIRTYASYLGLDGERLADEFERAPEPQPLRTPRRRRLPRAALSAILIVALLGVLLAVGLLSGGGGGGGPSSLAPRPASPGPGAGQAARRASGASAEGVLVSLTTRAEVWVCVLDGKGRALIKGEVLQGGVEEGPFHSGSFTVAFGNGEITMLVDGKQAEIPESSSPLGYAIDSRGHLRPLSEAERPTCL